MDTDVLVVGAGPTGLMLANQLARRGVRALIIDRHAAPSLQTRAAGRVQPGVETGSRRFWACGRGSARLLRGRTHSDRSAAAQHNRPGVFAGRLGRFVGGAVAYTGPGQDRGVRDELREHPAVCVSHHFSDRDSLPRQPSVESAAGPVCQRATRGRPVSLAASQAPGEWPERRYVRKTR